MVRIIFLLSVLGFVISFIGLFLWLINKSKEKFLELKKAYEDYKKAKNILLTDLDK